MTKNSKKIIFTVFMAVMLTVCMLAFTASAANEGPYVYEISNGEVTITKCNPTLSGDVVIPETLGGIPVTAIGEKAFYNCYEISSVTMYDNIRSIGKGAFAYCGALSEVILPTELEEIAEETFYMCFNLNKVGLSNTKIKSIGARAFAYCEFIESVALPDTLETVDEEAFNWCSNIQSLIIGKNTKNVGEYAFSKCYNIHSIYYMGTQQESQKINFAVGNDLLKASQEFYKHSHTYTSKTTSKGDCVTRGRTDYSCKCGDAYSDLSFGAHTYKSVITKATFTADGKTESKCSLCGNVKKTTVIPKITAVLTKTDFAYTGKAITPEPSVKNGDGATLTKDKSYTLKYSSGRKEMGQYAVRVTLSGSKYSGTTKLYFNIIPGRPSVTTEESVDSIKLTWKKITGAKGYRVYSYNTQTKKYTALKTLTGTSYTVTGLESGKDYVFSVRAYGKVDGETCWGNHSTVKTATVPATVKLSSVTSKTAGKATVTWAKTDATGYEVYMATGKNSDYKKVKTVTKNSTLTYTKSSLKSGTNYYFIVRAYKTVGDTKLYGEFSKVKYVCVK